MSWVAQTRGSGQAVHWRIRVGTGMQQRRPSHWIQRYQEEEHPQLKGGHVMSQEALARSTRNEEGNRRQKKGDGG